MTFRPGTTRSSRMAAILQSPEMPHDRSRRNLHCRHEHENDSGPEAGCCSEPIPGQGSVRYSNLPPDRYRFRVRACNEDSVWNDHGASLVIEVLPPFWKTWWFLAGMSLLALALIVGSVHVISTQRLQRQVERLRHQEALEKERARIARDLHDQLGANLTQVALLGEMAEADKELPHEIEAHAR